MTGQSIFQSGGWGHGGNVLFTEFLRISNQRRRRAPKPRIAIAMMLLVVVSRRPPIFRLSFADLCSAANLWNFSPPGGVGN